MNDDKYDIDHQREQRQMKSIFGSLISFLRNRFDLNEDKAEQNEVVENIRKGVEFRGTNLWILMFAIVVASVGLNVNSTAVIIGAMLISPLMGPIMGIGLALGINDFELFKRSLRNFVFSVSISLVVSTIYFWLSPLTIVQSEILARTTPTIWDVLIASFGGLAGIVAQSRKDRTSTVIPGVAIATALMPPLCTAGFGLASGEWSYFGGALYLFFINAVFIAFATFFIVRFLKYERKKQLDVARTKKVNRIMATIVVITVVPSVIMAYGIVQRTIFETAASNFINKVFIFESSEVVNYSYTYDPRGDGNKIEVVMMGETLSKDAIEAATNQLNLFSLKDTKLIVRQANNKDAIDNATLTNVLRSNTQIIDEKNALIKKLEAKLERFHRDTIAVNAITKELKTLYDVITEVELSGGEITNPNGDIVGHRIVCVLELKNRSGLKSEEIEKLKRWLLERSGASEVRLYVESSSNSSAQFAIEEFFNNEIAN